MVGLQHTPEEFRQSRSYGVAQNFTKNGIEATWAGPSGSQPAKWGSEDFSITYKDPFGHAALSPDEKFLALTTKNAVLVYSTSDWTLVETLNGPTDTVSHVEWQPGKREEYVLASIMWFDRQHIQTPSHKPEIVLWDLDADGKAKKRDLFPVNSHAVAGAVALDASELLKSRYQWTNEQVQAGHIVQGFTDTLERAAAKLIIDKNMVIQGVVPGASCCLFSEDGKTMLISRPEDPSPETSHIQLWDLDPLGRRLTLKDPEEKHDCFAVCSPDGHTIAATAWDAEKTYLYRADSGKLLYTLGPSGGTNWYPRFSPDGRLIAHGCDVEDAGIQIWDVTTGQKVYSGQTFAEWLRALAWSPDGARIAFSGKRGALMILNVAAGAIEQVWQAGDGEEYGPYTEISQIHWIDGGRKLAFNTGMDYGVEVYDLEKNVKWRFEPSKSDETEENFRTNMFVNMFADIPAMWCASRQEMGLLGADGVVRFWKLE